MVIRRKRKSTRRRKARRNPRRRKLSYGRHRPVLIKTRRGWRRPKRSRMGIGRKSVRVNRRRRRRTRRNPKLSLKSIFSQQKLMSAVAIGAGIVTGAVVMPLVYNVMPAGLKTQRRWLGGVHVAVGLLLTSLVKNKNLKTVGLVIAGTGIYDLIAQNVNALGLTPLPTSSMLVPQAQPASASYTPGLLGASYGVPTAPVSSVAGMMGASYQSGQGTVGLGCDDLSGTNPYSDIEF